MKAYNKLIDRLNTIATGGWKKRSRQIHRPLL
jgi:hypothetical protein